MSYSFDGIPKSYLIGGAIIFLLIVGVALYAAHAIIKGTKEAKEYKESALPEEDVRRAVEEAERSNRNELDSLDEDEIRSDVDDDSALPVPKSPFLEDDEEYDYDDEYDEEDEYGR